MLHSCHDGQEKIQQDQQLIKKILTVTVVPRHHPVEPGNVLICNGCGQKINEFAMLQGKLEKIQRRMVAIAILNSTKTDVTKGYPFGEPEECSRLKLRDREVLGTTEPCGGAELVTTLGYHRLTDIRQSSRWYNWSSPGPEESSVREHSGSGSTRRPVGLSAVLRVHLGTEIRPWPSTR